MLIELAMMIVRDGEGATRFVRLNIESAATYEEAVKVGRTVGDFAAREDGNFRRRSQLGKSFISSWKLRGEVRSVVKVELKIGDVCVFRRNEPQGIDLAKISDLFSRKEIEMTIKLNSGRNSARVYTCDLSYDYVKINGEYTT